MLQFFNDLYLNIKINDAKMKKSEDDGAGLPFASAHLAKATPKEWQKCHKFKAKI